MCSIIGVPMTVDLSNAILKVMLENETQFSSAEVLTEMRQNNIEPNETTYAHILCNYSRQGNLTAVMYVYIKLSFNCL